MAFLKIGIGHIRAVASGSDIEKGKRKLAEKIEKSKKEKKG